MENTVSQSLKSELVKENKNAYSTVAFFESDEFGTYEFTGKSAVSKEYGVSLNIYANTPCPASQILSAATEEELEKEVNEMIKNMKNRKWVQEHIDPFL